MNVHLVSLGCVRNLVDSEMMLGRLTAAGYRLTQSSEEADVIIVNTCSFIKPAVDEAIDTILELALLKKTGVCKRLIITGCLPERFREELSAALPEADLFLGTGAYEQIVQAVDGTLSMDSACCLPDPNAAQLITHDVPRMTTTPHFAYLKIAEGCSKHCTYCIIPKLRGRQRSRTVDDITSEADMLINTGKKEIILVAQDTTAYGLDLKPAVGFDRLLENIAKLSDKTWLRFLYGHPESITDAVIEKAAEHDHICSYFDLPIQHAGNPVLKKMGRQCSQDDLYRLFDKIRTKIPDASLRTTVLVGFPGETDKDFEELIGFVQTVQFDHLGVFTYSDSDDLPSSRLPGHVPEQLSNDRRDHLMSLQADISYAKNNDHIGKALDVLVEETLEDGRFMGRTIFQAPEVDGVTCIEPGNTAQQKIQPGSMVNVKIVGASDYDLTGEAV